jgi:hypothetical protein
MKPVKAKAKTLANGLKPAEAKWTKTSRVEARIKPVNLPVKLKPLNSLKPLKRKQHIKTETLKPSKAETASNSTPRIKRS